LGLSLLPQYLSQNKRMLKFKGSVSEMKDTLKKGLELEDFLDVTEVLKEQEEDYKRVLAEVNFETGNVEFHDAGNYMEVPIEVIQELTKQLRTK